MDGASSGDGLERGNLWKKYHQLKFNVGITKRKGPISYPAVFDGWTITSKDEFLRGAGEECKTSNWKIFVVELRVVAKDIIGL
jgi:hypothetical protein